jgi:Dyp-type peroxidase family
MDLTTRETLIRSAELPELQPVLSGIQANILTPFQRDHAMYAFLRFTAGRIPCRWAIRELAGLVTSEWVLRSERSEAPAISIGLSWPGFKALQLDPAPLGKAFRCGFRAFQLGLGSTEWRAPFDPLNRFDGIVSIAAASPDELQSSTEMVAKVLHPVASVTPQPGFVRRRDGRPIEHFGYVDGISQPVFYEDDERPLHWPQVRYPLSLILHREHWASGSYGSFLVFLKLEQHLDRYERAVRELAKKVEGADRMAREEYARALIMGRSRDGLPLVDPDGRKGNDFNYDHDPMGTQCPLASHIRKMNPRREGSKVRRIARRSTLYEEPGARGTLFQCYQSDIRMQFEHLMEWGFSNHRFEYGAGMDPLIGTRFTHSQKWPVARCGAFAEYSINSLITIRGGEYFYVPSIPFLSSI